MTAQPAELRVGIIGTGNIGTAHALSLTREVSGARVTCVFDADQARATAVADQVGACVCSSVTALIECPDVDAVLIASPDDLHAEQALACLAAGRPTLLEKPLAPVLSDAEAVMAAEVALGRRLITLGFMRRFDPAYQQMKAQLDAGAVGEALIVRNLHRNTAAPYGLRSVGTLTNSAIHEMDINRWLLGQDYASVQVILPKPGPQTPPGEFDPLLVFFTTTSGAVVEIEAFANAWFGYEVACQVVGSRGQLDLGDGSLLIRTEERRRGVDLPELWLGRFGDAYRRELQAWVDCVRGLDDGQGAATVWDGLAATTAAQAAARALQSGSPEAIHMPKRPALYQ